MADSAAILHRLQASFAAAECWRYGRQAARQRLYCDAIFHPVTGEQLNWSCQNARGDQMECGKERQVLRADDSRVPSQC